MNKKFLQLGLGLAAAATLSANASSIVIDDFLGGPHTVSLVSLTPPEIATSLAGFAHAGAIGGNRDAAVWSAIQGSYSAGVAFGAGGYASFAGKGAGAVVWDGTPGIADSNNDKRINVAEIGLGLDLNLIEECANPTISITAFADLPTAKLDLFLVTDHSNYAIYNIALNGPVNSFNAYDVALLSPTLTVGTPDFSDVKAIALFVDATNLANLDVLVSRFVISCPDGGMTLGLMGAGLLGLGLVRRQLSK